MRYQTKVIIEHIRKYPFFKQVVKFCIVGGTSAVINFLIYYSATQWLGFWYINSAIWAFLISAIFNFGANKFWTFRNIEKGREVLNQLIKFSVVMVSGLTINTGIIYSLTEFVNLHWLLSWVFATALVTVWNFSFNRFWTFKNNQIMTKLPLE
ncbi:MAG: hypothetical protein CMI53_03230 [Parcubacteria group bacterium]|jgi:putative flippase GtrA|nr:hypothetical protein [Parcubacteria group bacterium]|tara:strand:+ start:818 stop:1276 length:459 start_codon:yes stop_codon:yes gene_type:complete